MEARFGRIILQQVDKVLQDQPSGEALLDLLQISDPSFDEKNINDSKKRGSALRKLQLLLHPDKHPTSDKDAATKRFQDFQTFSSKCERCLHAFFKTKKKQRSKSAPPARGFSFGVPPLPLEFHIQDKWTVFTIPPREPIVPSDVVLDSMTLEKTMAFKCLNYRGAIAHGKKTECEYDFGNVQSSGKWALSFHELFNEHGGGYKILCSLQEIKEELISRGPVVSTSFDLSQAFYLNALEEGYSFEQSLVGQTHALLILGWKQTPQGEMWLVRTSKHPGRDIPIFTGQFNIEEAVFAPVTDLSDQPWQDDAVVLDVPNLPKDWYLYGPTSMVGSCQDCGGSGCHMTVHCKSERLESLFRSFGCSIKIAIQNQHAFVLREAERIAKSRYAYLKDIEWANTPGEFEWKVHVVFCDDIWNRD